MNSLHNQSEQHLLSMDIDRELLRITEMIRDCVFNTFRRKGVVVGISGGIDSSVVAALCVKALGCDRVLGLFMPERDSSQESLVLGKMIADQLEIETIHEDISPILEGAGCYRRRDDSIRNIFPQFSQKDKCKLVSSGGLKGHGYTFFSLVIETPDGVQQKIRLPLDSYLGIVAATNFKQRTRKMMEYYHADRLHYVVAGTPNRLEYELGFFVKNGDGSADLKPIAHLYKTQVYQLAEFLNIPESIRKSPPTTDTYSLPQSQEEFFFSLPYDKLDICLFGFNNAISPETLSSHVGLSVEQVTIIYNDIKQKKKTSNYLHHQPVIVETIL
jgi:NAD+ synthase